MSIGSFCVVKNENAWIAPHLLRHLPYLDEAVIFDSGSTDGTLEIVEAIAKDSPHGHKIKLFKDRDPSDLKGDYVRVFNDCLAEVKADYAFFAHPDFWITNPERLREAGSSQAVALSVKLRSFAGEPGGPLKEIIGRGQRWKAIHNTRFDLVYHGHYGAWNEDMYPTAIVGDEREFHGEHFEWYPYEVQDSGIELLHFSDVRPLERRYDRMVKCLLNQGQKDVENTARNHPRVTLKDGQGFKFVPAEYPAEFLEANEKYAHLRRTPASV